MSIEFWLSYRSGAEKLRLPVNPPSIEISTPFSHNVVEIARLGEYSVIGERGLVELAFESFLPAEYHESYCEYSDFPPPWEIVKTIERWRDSRLPMRLLVTSSPINYAVTIRDFTYEPNRAGETGDIYYSLAFKEYRFVDVWDREITKPAPKKKPRPPAPKPPPPKTYTVKKGDTLWAISKRYYGKGTDWRKIWNVKSNKDMLIKRDKRNKVQNGHWIYPGQKLVIP